MLSDQHPGVNVCPLGEEEGACYCFDVISLHCAGPAALRQICMLSRSVLHAQQSLTPFSGCNAGHRLYLVLDRADRRKHPPLQQLRDHLFN